MIDLSAWVTECCELDVDGVSKVRELHASFERWLYYKTHEERRQWGVPPYGNTPTQKQFRDILAQYPGVLHRRGNNPVFRGIRLKT